MTFRLHAVPGEFRPDCSRFNPNPADNCQTFIGSKDPKQFEMVCVYCQQPRSDGYGGRFHSFCPIAYRYSSRQFIREIIRVSKGMARDVEWEAFFHDVLDRIGIPEDDR